MSWLDYVFGDREASLLPLQVRNTMLGSPELQGRYPGARVQQYRTLPPFKGTLSPRQPSVHEEVVQAINENLYGGKPLGQTQAEFVGGLAQLLPQVAAAEGTEQV